MGKAKPAIVNLGIIALISWMVLSAMFSFFGISFSANSVSVNVVAGLTVTSTCMLAVSNTAINFPSTAAGTNSVVGNVVSDTNNGNAASYIWLYGSNWIGGYLAQNFFVTNTIYSNVFLSTGVGTNTNALQLASSNSYIPVFAGGTNTLYFGVNIPNGQAANAYSQNILFLNVC